jgi:hypothetical protein
MSWFIAVRPAQDVKTLDRVKRLHGPAVFSATIDDWYFACGGLPETAAGEVVSERELILRVGVDLRTSGERWRLSAEPRRIESNHAQGGFVAVSYRDGTVDVRTDPMGLRTAYGVSTSDGVMLSTRLDWLSRISGHDRIDFEAFGSHWRCHNQLSWRSFVRGIERLPAGGTLSTAGSAVSIREAAWTPDASARHTDMETVLRGALSPELPAHLGLTLGLSGGLDSRLLACLIDEPDTRLHTFGPATHPDVAVAHRMAGAVRRDIWRIDAPIPPPDEAIALARRHAAITNAVAPASASISLRHYDDLRRAGLALVDGGFGEIGRRQFMNRLMVSRRSIADRTPAELAAAIRFARADVFTPEVESCLVRGVLDDVDRVFAERPPVDGWTDADHVDLLGVRYRLPNFFGFEQARLDHHILSYMPFATPRFVEAVFATPMTMRRGGRSFRKTIRDLNPQAARLPLVKGTTTYPFWLSPLPAAAYTRLKSRIGLFYRDQRRAVFLTSVEPYVRDIVSSASIASDGIYDMGRLRSMVEAHYDGTTDHGPAIDWWLAFELWRQSIASS